MSKKDRTGSILAVMFAVVVLALAGSFLWGLHRNQQRELRELMAQWQNFHEIAFNGQTSTYNGVTDMFFPYTEQRNSLQLFAWDYRFFCENALRLFPATFTKEKLDAFADSVVRCCCLNIQRDFCEWRPSGNAHRVRWYLKDLAWSADTLGTTIKDLGWTQDSLDRFFANRIITSDRAWYDTVTQKGWPWLDDDIRMGLRNRWEEARAAMSERALSASGINGWEKFIQRIAPDVPVDVYHYRE